MLKRINLLLENRWFPNSFKILTLIAFIGLIIIGFSAHGSDKIFLRQLSKTNLTTNFVWDTWWPVIILSAIIFGRVWCMVCPVEMITTFFSRIGFKFKRPKLILSGWGITLFYAIIVIVGVTILEIDFYPNYTSFYLLIIVGISVISGLIFEKNTFCRYICPVGYLLGIFSKMAKWGWRVKTKPVCKACIDKSCISNKYTYKSNYKSCGVDLVPAEITDNSHCILCAGCLKTCKTYKSNASPDRPNPGLVKIGFADDLMQIKPLLFVEWFFLYFLSAHLIDEMTELRLLSNICFKFIPENISNLFIAEAGIGKDLFSASFLFFLLPVFLWILPYIFLSTARLKISFSNYIKSFSLVYIPIIISLFIGLIIMEVTLRFPYYKFILHDIKGIETIRGILTKQILVARLPAWTEWVFLLIMSISVLIGIVFSFKIIRQLALKFEIRKNRAFVYLLPVIFILLFFTEVLVYRCF